MRRAKRVSALAKAAGKRAAHRLFGTGLAPALGYASEVTGFSPAELQRVQFLGLKIVKPGNKGASRVPRIALEQGLSTAGLASAAIVRFAKEVWAALHRAPFPFRLLT